MKEYWVNVYDQNFKPLYEFSGKSTTREASIRLADINSTYCMERLLYRVHVKMKETKPFYHQRAGRISRPLTTHWMDD